MSDKNTFLEKFSKKNKYSNNPTYIGSYDSNSIYDEDDIKNEIFYTLIREAEIDFGRFVGFNSFCGKNIIFIDLAIDSDASASNEKSIYSWWANSYGKDFKKLLSQLDNDMPLGYSKESFETLYQKYFVLRTNSVRLMMSERFGINFSDNIASLDEFIEKLHRKCHYLSKDNDIKFVYLPKLPKRDELKEHFNFNDDDCNELAMLYGLVTGTFFCLLDLLGIINLLRHGKIIYFMNMRFSIFTINQFAKKISDFPAMKKLENLLKYIYPSFEIDSYEYAINIILNELTDLIKEQLGHDLYIDLESLDNSNDIGNFIEIFTEAMENTFNKNPIIPINEEEEEEEDRDADFLFNLFLHYAQNSNLKEQYAPSPIATDKSSSAILEFFNANSNTLVSKLKDSGVMLSVSALQNDQNIARVANVVYGLLPAMVRIFVNRDTIEKFLIENRQWLINKLV